METKLVSFSLSKCVVFLFLCARKAHVKSWPKVVCFRPHPKAQNGVFIVCTDFGTVAVFRDGEFELCVLKC